MTTYYTVSGAPVTHSFGSSAYIRTEFTSIQTAFGTVNSEMITKGAIAGQAWTGAHNFTGATVAVPTQTLGDNTTYAASTAFVYAGLALKANIASPTFTGTVTIPGGASISGYALLASPAFTGTPTAPTASTGTGTTQIANCAFVGATAFNAALPSQTGNSGKFVTTDGSNASWAFAGVSQVTTATTATTLTSTPTLLKITPASYGVTVTLPDATTCSVGGPLHIIDNRGAYPVRVCDSTGVLKAFVFAGVVSHISLDDNSTAAGVWAIENGELVGASAQLLTTVFTSTMQSIDLGSSQELLLCSTGSASGFNAVVYNRATNTFGSITLIRTTPIPTANWTACLSATNQVLVCSCSSTTAFEAVCLSITGTSIAVGTAATATLGANFASWADGCGLIAVGSSFSALYLTSTPTAEIRAMSISGTTVTISSAATLTGTAGISQIAATSTVVITTSTATTHFYTLPYTFSGASTPSVGTGTDTNAGTTTFRKFFALGTRWGCVIQDGTNGIKAGLVSLSGTTTTISFAVMTTNTGSNFADAIVVGTNKVLCLHGATTNNANILTDTAGTASAGTAITLASTNYLTALYVSGTDVYVWGSRTSPVYAQFYKVSCSGASAVLTSTQTITVTQDTYLPLNLSCVSNAVLSRNPRMIYGTAFAQSISSFSSIGGQIFAYRYRDGALSLVMPANWAYTGSTSTNTPGTYRGKADSERWITDASTVITKIECVQ